MNLPVVFHSSCLGVSSKLQGSPVLAEIPRLRVGEAEEPLQTILIVDGPSDAGRPAASVVFAIEAFRPQCL